MFAITQNVIKNTKKNLQIQNTKIYKYKTQKLDWIADRAVRQREDINCVRNHSVRNAAIMHYTGAQHWNLKFLNGIRCIGLCCITLHCIAFLIAAVMHCTCRCESDNAFKLELAGGEIQ